MMYIAAVKDGSIESRALSFEVSGPSTITVYAMGGTSGAHATNDRTITLDDGTTKIAKIFNELSAGVYNYTGEATRLYLYPSGGMRIYGIKVEASTTPIVWPVRAENFQPLQPQKYYTIKGEPLGAAKPTKAGIYIVKQGSSIHKIVVR
jgi:hypothetical protein